MFSLPVLLSIWLVGEPTAFPNGKLDLPPRPAAAISGTEFYNRILNMTETEREQEVVNQIARGNVPDFLRTLKPITVTHGTHTATYHATVDYMAIGSDADFFRMPMSAPLGQQIADIAGCSLPTRKIVIDLHVNSDLRLTPSTFNPSTYDIDSVPVFKLNNDSIESKRAGQPLGLLIDGIKKDVVLTPIVPTRPSPARVAIVGWFYNSNPLATPTRTDSYIQPLSTIHESTYEDYSHGIRLIENELIVDGQVMTVAQVLADPVLAPLLTDESANTFSRYPIPNPYPIDPGDNLVANGSFEGTYTGGVAESWTSWTAPGSAAMTFGRASINHFDGAHSQYFARGDTSPVDAGIFQTVAVEPGKTYTISAQIKRQSTLAGTFVRFGYDLDGGTNPSAGSVVYTDITGTTDNVWQPCQTSVTATGSAITLFARCGHTGTTGGTNAYFYVDAVSLRETTN